MGWKGMSGGQAGAEGGQREIRDKLREIIMVLMGFMRELLRKVGKGIGKVRTRWGILGMWTRYDGCVEPILGTDEPLSSLLLSIPGRGPRRNLYIFRLL